MKRIEAIKTILNTIGKDDIALFTTGFISREANHIRDRASNFYMVGSMGLLSAVGAGLALCAPARKVVIVEGDGSAFMCLGNLAIIGKEKLANIIHIVLDNGVYGSTGGQACISSTLDISSIAKECGYKHNITIKKEKELESTIRNISKESGPNFIRIVVDRDSDKDAPRINLSCENIKKRLMKSLNC